MFTTIYGLVFLSLFFFLNYYRNLFFNQHFRQSKNFRIDIEEKLQNWKMWWSDEGGEKQTWNWIFAKYT